MHDAGSHKHGMSREIMPFSDAVRFHGHTCPGLTIGYRAAEAAIRELATERDVNEELVAIVENDSCSVDAIQAVTGCTLGKGNLIFKDSESRPSRSSTGTQTMPSALF
jgi:formylmethanofuran dehydrogenase subunit E